MKERPISFNYEMMRAYLAGRKTQTRRIIKPQDERMAYLGGVFADGSIGFVNKDGKSILCPYGKPGDLLWVKENFAYKSKTEVIYQADFDIVDGFGSEIIDFRTGNLIPLVWRSSRFMPRWASRIKFPIISIRPERVLEISEEDAKAEGTTPSIVGADLEYLRYRAGFQTLWDGINAKRGHPIGNNDWVWRIEFPKYELEDPETDEENPYLLHGEELENAIAMTYKR